VRAAFRAVELRSYRARLPGFEPVFDGINSMCWRRRWSSGPSSVVMAV